MSETKTRRPNFWAAIFGFMILLPIGILSFDNVTSGIIIAVAGAVAGAFLFPVKK